MIPKKPAPDLIPGEDRFSGKFVLKTRIQRTRRSTRRGARHTFLQPPVAPARVRGRRGAAKALYHCCTAVEMPNNGVCIVALHHRRSCGGERAKPAVQIAEGRVAG